MERVEMWKAYDGQCFDSPHECKLHEQSLAAGVLDPYIQGFNSDGKPVSWGVNGEYICFARLIKYPGDDKFDELAFNKAWADYLDIGLEFEISHGGTLGWYVRDPYNEKSWYKWEDYARNFNQIKDALTGLREKWGYY